MITKMCYNRNLYAQITVHTPAPVHIAKSETGRHIHAHALKTSVVSGTIDRSQPSDSLRLAGTGVGRSLPVTHPARLTESCGCRCCFTVHAHIAFQATVNEFSFFRL